MGCCPLGTSSHPGETTRGSKNRDPTSNNQNPATHNTHPSSNINRVTPMEKPHLPDQHQCPIGPTIATRFRKCVTPRPSPSNPTKLTCSATHDLRYEAMAGSTPMPAFPATTVTRAGGDHGSSPTRVAPRILLVTTFRPSVRATSAALLMVPLALVPQKSGAYDLYTGHYTASSGRVRTDLAGPATKGEADPHVPSQVDEPRNFRRKTLDLVQHMVENGDQIPKLLSRNNGSTEDCLGRHPPYLHHESMGFASLRYVWGR